MKNPQVRVVGSMALATGKDRDQLWAEAAVLEARGDSIILPERLWGAATDEQEKRRSIHPWEDRLAQTAINNAEVVVSSSTGEREYRILTNKLFDILNLPTGSASSERSRTLRRVMEKLGWERTIEKITIGDDRGRGYLGTPPDAPLAGIKKAAPRAYARHGAAYIKRNACKRPIMRRHGAAGSRLAWSRRSNERRL